MTSMLSVRRFAPLGVWLAVMTFSGVVVAQDPVDAVRTDVPPFWRAVGNFVLTLVVGGILLVSARDYVVRIGERIRKKPGGSFLWGLAILLLFTGAGVILVLFVGVLGRLLFIVLLIAFVVVAIVGNVLAYLALFEWLVDNRWFALVLAATVGSVLAIVPVVGQVAGFLATSIGVGAIVRKYRA